MRVRRKTSTEKGLSARPMQSNQCMSIRLLYRGYNSRVKVGSLIVSVNRDQVKPLALHFADPPFGDHS